MTLPLPERRSEPGLNELTGYLSDTYANAFQEFGEIIRLRRSHGLLLSRRIPGSQHFDLMALRPYFFARDWSALEEDLLELGDNWVSLIMITDPFTAVDVSALGRYFDNVEKFKKNFVADLTGPFENSLSKSHRANANRALNKVAVEVCENPSDFIDDWNTLYTNLIDRHGISGIDAYSPQSFVSQLQTPGMIAFRAVKNEKTLGLDLWCQQGDIAHAHLVAMSPEGYASGASYATKWTAIQYFSKKIKWMNFGGLPGNNQDESKGLGHFKAGWSNSSRDTYICKRIFDKKSYELLSKDVSPTTYFPAYRSRDAL